MRVIAERLLDTLSIDTQFIFFGRCSMVDSVPAELLELQTRFEAWRANRKYVRESMPDELRSAVLEMRRRYPASLIQRVLKVDPARLKKRPPTTRSTPKVAAPKKRPKPARPTRPTVPKRKSKSPTCAQVAALPQPAFFKLPAVAAPPANFPAATTQAPCRLQLERGDGSRLTLTLPGFDASIINSLVADFLQGGRL
jgi:hypothetical protein